MQKKILIAVDNSVTSSFSLEYLACLFADNSDVSFHLLHCLSTSARVMPDPVDANNSLLPPGKDAKQCDVCLEKCRQKLISLGIDETRVSGSCEQSSAIPQTLIATAEKMLVDAVVVARRGVGVVGEMLLGSVSSGLFQKCRKIPLWIVDGAICSKKLLVPVDGTPSSLMAIDHLAHIFAGRSDVEIYLFHARGFLSPQPVCKPEDFYDKWGKQWCDTHLSGHGCMFTGPTELLSKAGIPLSSITTLPVPTAIEESMAIISNARKNECGTIVIGRRPASDGGGFFGGVTKRTVLQTEDLALWVIG